ncbi:MAG: pilus assembly protein [Planctomycetes bacterium]|nr:pilus assembly protein [Planctomycetota bacterium]
MARLTKYKRRRGTAAVEAALMMPLVVLMTFALIKFGWLYVKVQQINNAARHGARVAVRADSDNGTVQTEIDALMANVWPSGAGAPPDGWYTVTFEPGDVDGLAKGTIITISIETNYSGTPLDIMPMPLVPVPGSIGGTASMAKEGT